MIEKIIKKYEENDIVISRKKNNTKYWHKIVENTKILI